MRRVKWASLNALFPDTEGGDLAPRYRADAAAPEPYVRPMPAPSGHLVELEQRLAGRLADFDDTEASGLS